MGSKSDIEWTDASYTPIRARNLKTGKVGWHCEHATTGCEFCYAETLNKRLGTGLPFKPGHRSDIEIFLDPQMLLAPLKWKKSRMIFVCSMTDLFADFVPDEWIDAEFAIMALTPHHTYQVLTKRAERMRDYLSRKDVAARWVMAACQIAKIKSCYDVASPVKAAGWQAKGLPNVWLGISTERQKEADERIPLLLDTPAAVRFVSAEPLLGPLDLSRICIMPQKPGSIRAGIHLNALTGRYCESGMPYLGDWDINGPCPPPSEQRRLDWVITGGESGPNARPSHPQWFRDIRDACEAAGVAFFFKQWGTWGRDAGITTDERARERIFEGTASCAVWEGDRWSYHDNGYQPDSHAGIGEWVYRLGKKAAGRLLDGITHDAMPSPPDPAFKPPARRAGGE